MIIGIDGTCLQGVRTGAGWYLTNLLEAMSHILEEDKIYVWMNNPTPEERARVSENRFISVSATHYPLAALKLTWNTLGTPAADSLIGRQADVYFYPNYLPLPQKQGKKVLFCHDLLYLTNPEMASQATVKILSSSFEKQEELADLVLTCSDYNKREMLKYFKHLNESKIRVIPHGLPEAFRKPASQAAVQQVKEKHLLSKPYFLFVGKLEPRKNLLRLVHSFLIFKQQVHSEHQLVLAGPKGWIGEDFFEFLLSPQLVEKVRWLDYVAPEELPALYTASEAFLFPSLKEGFGMPLLEAMGCGTPVICSNSAAIPEVVGDGAWMVDPSDVGQWSQAMTRIVREPDFGNVLKEKGRARTHLFQIDNTAKQTLAALKMTVQSHG
ncbi:MAG TPA: glycosyltransferase family 1 protein [bacterium]